MSIYENRKEAGWIARVFLLAILLGVGFIWFAPLQTTPAYSPSPTQTNQLSFFDQHIGHLLIESDMVTPIPKKPDV
jgi:hypothetical protein